MGDRTNSGGDNNRRYKGCNEVQNNHFYIHAVLLYDVVV